MRKFINRVKKDNAGVALLSVMITMTVCLLIASIVLELTYTSLMSRKVNSAATDNFYSAESAIDDMETVLQSIAVYSAQQYQSGGDSFIDVATEKLCASAGISSLSDANATEQISKYMFDNLDPDLKKILGSDPDGDGVYTWDSSKFEVSAVTSSEAGELTSSGRITLSVSISYTNDKGFLTSISTDLILNDITHRTPATAKGLGTYSMFNGGGVKFYDGSGDHNGCYVSFLQEGNAYIGTQAGTKTSMEIDDIGVIFDGTRIIINGDIYLTNYASLSFTGKKVKDDGTVEYPEIDVRGTIYIDGTSVLTISEGCDFMCQDIKLVGDSETWSVFTDYTKGCQINYDGSSTYYSMFPYTTNDKDEVKNMANSTGSVDSAWMSSGGFSNGIGGVILYRTETSTQPLDYKVVGGTGYWYTADGTKVTGATINASSTFAPEAMATVYAYDGKTITTDAELCNFINVNLLYWQSRVANTVLVKDTPRLVTNTTTDTCDVKKVTQTGADISVNALAGVTSSNLSMTSENVTTALDGTLSTQLTPVTQNGGVYGIGPVNTEVMNEGKAGKIAIVMFYPEYTVQLNGGYNYVGLFVSNKKTDYKCMGKGVAIGYSLLSLKDYYPSEATAVETYIKKLAYLTAYRNSPGQLPNQTNEAEYAYALCSYNSLIIGGTEALLADENSAATGTGDVTLSSSGMYDFIKVENWTVNE